MSKAIFTPVSIVTGLLAGMVGKKLFQRFWALIEDREPPQAQERDRGLDKLALALVVEGALFRALKGLADHGSRRAFARLTGSWPGKPPAVEK